MIVKIEDTIYKVSWKHTAPVELRNKMSGQITQKVAGNTRCTIEVIKDMTTNPYVTELVDTAIAFCHSNDQFNKSIGRKYSLKKAIKFMPKYTRTQFWDAYFKEHKQ